MKPGAISLLLTFVCLFNKTVSAFPRKWAVFVASSNGWHNYRHQSDVCRAYQILRANDFPANQIITMMYDDIAHHPSNPSYGKIFNDYKQVDTYNGVEIDYNATDVTPDMLLKILKGNSELSSQGKKVLESGPEDEVFIYISGLGGVMTLLFPQDVLYADELNMALAYMKQHNMYKNMVIYLEACYSGSMFENILAKDMGIYVMTSADANQCSFAAFCRLEFMATCLGNGFSSTWMNHLEKANVETCSLDDLYMATKDAITRSNVSSYGDQMTKNMPVGDFVGIKRAIQRQMRSIPRYWSDRTRVALNEVEKRSRLGNFVGNKPGTMGQRRFIGDKFPEQNKVVDAIRSDEAHLMPFYSKFNRPSIQRLDTSLAGLKLDFNEKRKELVKKTVEYIQRFVQSKELPNQKLRTAMDIVKCYRQIHESYSKRCFPAYSTTEAIGYHHVFRDMCEYGFDPRGAVEAIEELCN